MQWFGHSVHSCVSTKQVWKRKVIMATSAPTTSVPALAPEATECYASAPPVAAEHQFTRVSSSTHTSAAAVAEHSIPASVPSVAVEHSNTEPSSKTCASTSTSAPGDIHDAFPEPSCSTSIPAPMSSTSKVASGLKQNSGKVQKNAPRKKVKTSTENKFSPLELEEEMKKGEGYSRRDRKLTAKALELE